VGGVIAYLVHVEWWAVRVADVAAVKDGHILPQVLAELAQHRVGHGGHASPPRIRHRLCELGEVSCMPMGRCLAHWVVSVTQGSQRAILPDSWCNTLRITACTQAPGTPC
jgi:hypothetical protein